MYNEEKIKEIAKIHRYNTNSLYFIFEIEIHFRAYCLYTYTYIKYNLFEQLVK